MLERLPKPRTTAALVAGLITAIAIFLLVDRGGLIAWGTLMMGAGLLAKIWLRPSGIDLGLSTGLATVSALAWAGTFYYVISTWESGEVVELTIDTYAGSQTARVWVLDIEAHPIVYYDAPPEAARSLLAGRPLQFLRGGEVSTRIPEAAEIDALPQDDAELILETMTAKYGDRVGAADVYYVMLGRPRDRIAVVASLIEE